MGHCKLVQFDFSYIPTSLTQKHQLEKSLVVKHCVNTGRSRAFVFRTGHLKSVIVYPEFERQAVWGHARVSLRPARDYSCLNGRTAEGRSYVSLPASLRKSPIATVPSLNDLTLHHTDTLLFPICIVNMQWDHQFISFGCLIRSEARRNRMRSF